MNKNEQLARKHGAKVFPFKKLPVEARYALIQYMVVDGAAWDVSIELSNAFTKGHKIMNKVSYNKVQALYKKAIKKSLKFYMEKYGDCKFGYVHFPTKELMKMVWERSEGIKSWDEEGVTFKEYWDHFKYDEEVENHPRTNRWPCILSCFNDEALQDGWHRFLTYVQMKCRTIPCVFYLTNEKYKIGG